MSLKLTSSPGIKKTQLGEIPHLLSAQSYSASPDILNPEMIRKLWEIYDDFGTEYEEKYGKFVSNPDDPEEMMTVSKRLPGLMVPYLRTHPPLNPAIMRRAIMHTTPEMIKNPKDFLGFFCVMFYALNEASLRQENSLIPDCLACTNSGELPYGKMDSILKYDGPLSFFLEGEFIYSDVHGWKDNDGGFSARSIPYRVRPYHMAFSALPDFQRAHVLQSQMDKHIEDLFGDDIAGIMRCNQIGDMEEGDKPEALIYCQSQMPIKMKGQEEEKVAHLPRTACKRKMHAFRTLLSSSKLACYSAIITRLKRKGYEYLWIQLLEENTELAKKAYGKDWECDEKKFFQEVFGNDRLRELSKEWHVSKRSVSSQVSSILTVDDIDQAHMFYSHTGPNPQVLGIDFSGNILPEGTEICLDRRTPHGAETIAIPLNALSRIDALIGRKYSGRVDYILTIKLPETHRFQNGASNVQFSQSLNVVTPDSQEDKQNDQRLFSQSLRSQFDSISKQIRTGFQRNEKSGESERGEQERQKRLQETIRQRREAERLAEEEEQRKKKEAAIQAERDAQELAIKEKRQIALMIILEERKASLIEHALDVNGIVTFTFTSEDLDILGQSRNDLQEGDKTWKIFADDTITPSLDEPELINLLVAMAQEVRIRKGAPGDEGGQEEKGDEALNDHGKDILLDPEYVLLRNELEGVFQCLNMYKFSKTERGANVANPFPTLNESLKECGAVVYMSMDKKTMTLNLQRLNTRFLYRIDGSIERVRDSRRTPGIDIKIPPQKLTDGQRRALHDLGELIQDLHIFANMTKPEQDEMVEENADEIIDEKEMVALCKSFQMALNGKRGARVIRLPKSVIKSKKRYQNFFPVEVTVDCIFENIKSRKELESKLSVSEKDKDVPLLLYASPAVEFNGRRLGQDSRESYQEMIFQSRRHERIQSLRGSPLGLQMLKERIEATLKGVERYAILKTNRGYTVLKDFIGEAQWKNRKNIVVDEAFLQGYIDAMITGGVSVKYRRPIFTTLDEHDKLVAKLELERIEASTAAQ